MDELLTAAEVADQLRMEVHFVYREIKAGRLVATKLGSRWRIRASDLERFLEPQPAVGPPLRSQRDRVRDLIKGIGQS